MYKVYFIEDHGWIHSKGWTLLKAETAKEAREKFKKMRPGAEIIRVRKG